MHDETPKTKSPRRDPFAGLGDALVLLRRQRGLNQAEAAARAGMTKGMISMYESGKQKPSLDSLSKILESLGCGLDDLDAAMKSVRD
jgi:transcriptional regulator with XRE-family HTH domain